MKIEANILVEPAIVLTSLQPDLKTMQRCQIQFADNSISLFCSDAHAFKAIVSNITKGLKIAEHIENG